MKKLSVLIILLALLSVVVFSTALADGTETLGPPSVPIASGSGFVAAGIGLDSIQPGTINVNVPGTVQQALLYWSGEFYTNGSATDAITVNGTGVVGDLIGGPTYFYYNFGSVFVAAYRADITALVASGPNSLQVSGLDFDSNDHGAGVLVIYDDGSGTSEIDLRDGLDLAFFGFDEPLQNTVPQTFNFTPAAVGRTAELVIFAGSVGTNRPNTIDITVSGVTTTLVDPLFSSDGQQWDTLTVPVSIPAGASSLTVQIYSTPISDPLGASLSWIGAGLSVPPVPLAAIGDFVWEDLNYNGIQDAGESGIPGVTVNLYDCQGNPIASTTTDGNGFYLFDGLMPGDYNIEFVQPAGYNFSPQNVGGDDAVDSDADPVTGFTECTTLVSGETDLTWDAGLFMVMGPGTGTPGYWMNHPEAWPVDEIEIGGVTYSKEEAIAIMLAPVKGDKTYTMFPALVAAKLNVLIGNESSCIADTIAAADAWMASYPLGSSVTGKSAAWKVGEPLSWMLDEYNNGYLCAPHRD